MQEERKVLLFGLFHTQSWKCFYDDASISQKWFDENWWERDKVEVIVLSQVGYFFLDYITYAATENRMFLFNFTCRLNSWSHLHKL